MSTPFRYGIPATILALALTGNLLGSGSTSAVSAEKSSAAQSQAAQATSQQMVAASAPEPAATVVHIPRAKLQSR
jgi:hypothetical protein